jgi:tyrosyl-tRNA synthetase
MSKSLGNYVGVTEPPEVMYAKLLSISDQLMWRYFALLTDLMPAEIEADRARGAPMASKMALARRIVADFHGASRGEAAETEWRRVHQSGEMPSDVPTTRIPAGRFRPHDLLTRHGLAPSNSQAVRLLKQRAVRRDGVVLGADAELIAEPGASFVLSVGPSRFVRFEVDEALPDRA